MIYGPPERRRSDVQGGSAPELPRQMAVCLLLLPYLLPSILARVLACSWLGATHEIDICISKEWCARDISAPRAALLFATLAFAFCTLTRPQQIAASRAPKFPFDTATAWIRPTYNYFFSLFLERKGSRITLVLRSTSSRARASERVIVLSSVAAVVGSKLKCCRVSHIAI